MNYPYVQSYVDLGAARGPRLAVVWHLAEGGGTVGYLAKENPNGVSVHFVVEYTGRIVQMLGLSRMHTSIRPSSIRITDDAPYDWRGERIVYGRTAAKTVLGEWADTAKSLGPNHASIGVEIEGFAARGPNDKQKDAIARLWADLSARHPGIRSLGHRDFASYKACPGKLFPWEEVGGHGPAVIDQEEPVYSVPGNISAVAPEGTPVYSTADAKTPAGKTGVTRRYVLVAQDVAAPAAPTRYLVDGAGAAAGGKMAWLPASALTDRRDEDEHWFTVGFKAGRDRAAAAAKAVTP